MKRCLLYLLTLTACLLAGCIPLSAAQRAPRPTEKPAAQAQTAEPSREEPTAEPSQDPQPREEPAAAGLRPFSFSLYAQTCWKGEEYIPYLYVDANGEGCLRLPHDDLFITEKDGELFLEKRMFAQPYDDVVAYTLTVGKVSLLTDGKQVQLSVLEDPLGIMAYHHADGMILRRDDNGGGPFIQTSDDVLKQPNTRWSLEYYNYGCPRISCGCFDMDKNMVLRGWLDLESTDGYAHDYIFYYCNYSFMLVGENGPLFYGYQWLGGDDPYFSRESFVKIILKPVYDPLNMAEGDVIVLLRENAHDDEYDIGYLPGANYTLMQSALLAAGWTDETAGLGQIHPGLVGRFGRFMKDGMTLVAYYESDDSRFGPEQYLLAYVIYGEDGAVLSWCGGMPASAKDTEGGNWWDYGFMVRRLNCAAPYIYTFLDNGCLVVEGVWDDSKDFVEGYRVCRMIP